MMEMLTTWEAGKHVPLFMATLLLLVIFLLYTSLLICIQFLQQKSNYRILKTETNQAMHILDPTKTGTSGAVLDWDSYGYTFPD